jgi:hypothetical protein
MLFKCSCSTRRCFAKFPTAAIARAYRTAHEEQPLTPCRLPLIAEDLAFLVGI